MNCMTVLMTTSQACHMGLANAVMVTQMPFSMDGITANKITGINARNAQRTISNQHPEWKSASDANRVRKAGLGAKNADIVPNNCCISVKVKFIE